MIYRRAFECSDRTCVCKHSVRREYKHFTTRRRKFCLDFTKEISQTARQVLLRFEDGFSWEDFDTQLGNESDVDVFTSPVPLVLVLKRILCSRELFNRTQNSTCSPLQLNVVWPWECFIQSSIEEIKRRNNTTSIDFLALRCARYHCDYFVLLLARSWSTTRDLVQRSELENLENRSTDAEGKWKKVCRWTCRFNKIRKLRISVSFQLTN